MRRTIAIRQTIAAGVALFGLLFIIGHCSCAPSVDAAEARAKGALTVDQYRRALDACVEEGKDAGSRAVYTRCADEADKRYGGVK